MSRTRTRRHPQSHRQTTPTAVADTPIPDTAPILRPVPATGTARRPVSLVKLQRRPHRTHTALHPQPAALSPLWLDLTANAAQAALYAGSLRIHAPYSTWTGMSTGQATALVNPDDPGSIRLVYAWGSDGSHLTATQQCRHQQWHAALLAGRADLIGFAGEVAGCDTHNPRAIRARNLGNGIHRASSAVAETQAIPQAHAADNDQPKEHPDHA